jgi:hypothetical protein
MVATAINNIIFEPLFIVSFLIWLKIIFLLQVFHNVRTDPAFSV